MTPDRQTIDLSVLDSRQRLAQPAVDCEKQIRDWASASHRPPVNAVLRRDELIATTIRLAMAGDATARRLCLDRVVPSLKPTAPPVLMPALPADLVGKGQQVMSQLAAGEISPDEAATIMRAVAQLARIMEVSDLERGIAALEGRSDAPG